MDRLPDALRDSRHTVAGDGRVISMQSAQPAKTIVEAVKWIDSLGLELIDIHLKRPTLEDVFIELTGKRLREA
jgi:ABC-2 type transport system ATP-binding protein